MAGSDHPAVATVGRAVDLAEIADLVAGAGGPDNPATVLVTGLPGIGRSTVLDAAVAAHPGPTLTLRCLPEDRAHRPGALTTRLARLITLEPSGDLADELRRRCAAATLLLAVDDLHWADDDSVDLLARLSAELEGEAFAVLATAVPYDPPAALRRYLERLHDEGGLREVLLSPLDDASVRTLATARTGAPPSPDLVACLAYAGGNPLHVMDLLTTAPERRAPHCETGPDRRCPAPASRDLPVARPALSEPTRELLVLGSLLDRSFTARELCVATGRRMTDLLPFVLEAVRAGVLVEADAGRLGFRDEATRTRMAEELPFAVRIELHRDLAGRLDEGGVVPELVARHLLYASTGRSDLGWLTSLACRTQRRAPATSAALWTRVRDLTIPGDPRRAEAEGGIALAELRDGDPARAELTARHALEHGVRSGRAGDAHRALTLSLLHQGRWPAARATAETVAHSTALFPAERAEQLALAATAAMYDGRLELARDTALRAEQSARNAGSEPSLRHTSIVRARLAQLAGRSRTAERLLRSAGSGSHGGSVWAETALALTTVLAYQDRFADARVVAQPAGATEAGHPARRVLAHARAVLTVESEPCGAVELLGDGLNDEPIFPPGATAALTARQSLVVLARSGPGPAVGMLERLPTDLGPTRWYDGVGWTHLARAVHHELRGNPAAAADELAGSWSALLEIGLRVEALVVGPALATLAAVRGDEDTLEEVASTIGDLADLTPDVASLGSAAALAAGLAAGDRAQLRAAVALGLQSPRWLMALRTAEYAATALERLGDPAAVALLRQVAQSYSAVGARDAARRLRAGVPLPPSQRTRKRRSTVAADGTASGSPDRPALTPTEQVVAAQVERGMTNAQIAAVLVLSRRTVETHVSHILAKLHHRSRADLILAAARDGRIPTTPSVKDANTAAANIPA